MPHIKNALLRYRIIDKSIRSKQKPYPSKKDLRLACEESLYGTSLGENICNSTIEKDMFFMKMEHDAPIKYSKRYNGYYYTDEKFSFDEVPLTDDDIQSIKFAASTLDQFKGAPIFKQFGFALNKIIDRVSVSENSAEEVVKYIQFETGTTISGSEHLSPLLSAIKNNNICYFYYESFVTAKRKKRKVTPLLLKEYRNRWYIITFDLIKENIITYGLDRIENLEISDEKGSVPKKFNPDLYFKYSIGITTTEASPQQIIFKANNIAAKYIYSQPFHESQKIIKKVNEFTTFELYVLITEELIREFLRYSGEIQVIEPLALKNEIIHRLKNNLSLYS